MLTYHNDIVSANEEVKSLPEYKALSKHKDLDKILKYVHFVYNKDSIYKNILISERRKVVCVNYFGKNISEDFEGDEKIRNFIQVFKNLSMTHKERLIEGIEQKIDEYLTFWKNIQIGDDNHKLVTESLENSHTLLVMQEKLEKLKHAENAIKQMGGGESKLFEDQ